MALASRGRVSCASSLRPFIQLLGNYSIVYTEADSKRGTKLRRESRTNCLRKCRNKVQRLQRNEFWKGNSCCDSQSPSSQAEAKLRVWRERVLYSTVLWHLHHALRQFPMKKLKTYLKPLISAGEVQNCLERTWHHTFNLKDNNRKQQWQTALNLSRPLLTTGASQGWGAHYSNTAELSLFIKIRYLCAKSSITAAWVQPLRHISETLIQYPNLRTTCKMFQVNLLFLSLRPLLVAGFLNLVFVDDNALICGISWHGQYV